MESPRGRILIQSQSVFATFVASNLNEFAKFVLMLRTDGPHYPSAIIGNAATACVFSFLGYEARHPARIRLPPWDAEKD